MRPIPPTSVLLALLIPLLQSVAGPVSAAEPGKPWKALFARCQKLSNEGDYQGGLEACDKAYELNPDPGILAYMAQIHTALLHPVQARETLERYLHSGTIDEANRKTAEAQLRYLETLLGTLLITTSVDGAEVRVDDQVIDPGALAHGVQLTAGAHRVTLRAKSATFSRFVLVRAGERTRVELPASGSIALSCAVPEARFFIDDQEVDAAEASNGATRAAGSHRVTFKVRDTVRSEQPVIVQSDERVLVVCTPPSPPSVPVPSTQPRSRTNPRGYWVAGAGLALGGAALATAIYNGNEYDRWQTANDSLRRHLLAQDLALTEQVRRAQENNQLMESIQTRRKVALGLGIAGGLVTAGGIALLFVDSAATESASSSWFRRVAAGMAINGAATSGEIAWRGAW